MQYKLILLALLVVVAASACGKKNSPNTEPVGLSAEVSITKDGFSPAELTVKQGTQVIFKNEDSRPHWPESDLPGFDSLQGIPAGQTYSVTFTRPGIWAYKDHLNKTLKGSVTVTE
ncbi:MAG: hypothetical protein A3J07_00535 [Candidatus Doudnabacteria bacterium RIFCSPLOWO2_02_FULL_49_13]|uniref:EfeO-type cupredoxin-like domain-containing protein n=1 Tax=Candidatus Doudnabacteria bacterium RIFCSPHIGHO2_12_FULL_48_16 TaxID=1817838 RepID=A0A1F5PKP5_9BACT|nr:MAG: hypothetical protein A3B77_03450 [Candidatus Doudnabacteria bacterium RIFCSPHIGHO2_02_FULL_49_24]OGE88494.1 MAG: hypothetical protein A2760_00185 [Candidatus Doudnabacteria bacterium RIFCSPHIGHO2_01_FULL_50_67]OGE90242.1 MAG: hypothetical protein A3E29_04045 [Candidatus Doudnabacteria bacterium RIFCSPHIGHO2_12_FULL_48_16]OGE96899.1 MAG: hypothetical protein A2990_03835 [Candidatus Doudnabacteria bacterium RIFCSPLOWO2_01_FULL_49_40]OGF02298.1 MAG: hypothetical protein A3J07_00535 [Candid